MRTEAPITLAAIAERAGRLGFRERDRADLLSAAPDLLSDPDRRAMIAERAEL